MCTCTNHIGSIVSITVNNIRQNRLYDGIIDVIHDVMNHTELGRNTQKILDELCVLNDLVIEYHDAKHKCDIVEMYDILKQLQQENLEYKKIINSLHARVEKLETLNSHQLISFL